MSLILKKYKKKNPADADISADPFGEIENQISDQRDAQWTAGKEVLSILFDSFRDILEYTSELEMRKFNRAADCTGMVSLFQRYALAYTKAGYNVTKEQGIEPLSSKAANLNISEPLEVKMNKRLLVSYSYNEKNSDLVIHIGVHENHIISGLYDLKINYTVGNDDPEEITYNSESNQIDNLIFDSSNSTLQHTLLSKAISSVTYQVTLLDKEQNVVAEGSFEKPASPERLTLILNENEEVSDSWKVKIENVVEQIEEGNILIIESPSPNDQVRVILGSIEDVNEDINFEVNDSHLIHTLQSITTDTITYKVELRDKNLNLISKSFDETIALA